MCIACITDTEVDTVRLKAILANMCACIQMSKWTYNPRGELPYETDRRGCSSEILNLTPKGDHLGVAQTVCDP